MHVIARVFATSMAILLTCSQRRTYHIDVKLFTHFYTYNVMHTPKEKERNQNVMTEF